MKRKITFLELTIFHGVVPLASGYMQMYASKDPMIRENCVFRKFSFVTQTEEDVVFTALNETAADVYAFSCYVWNMGLVRRLLKRLSAAHPDAYFILGGPQVMNHGHLYLTPQQERIVLCNGEGELTFHQFLREILEENESRDFSRVRGLSFYQGDRLVTTEPQERMASLDEIPSPFLGEIFEEEEVYLWAVIETNRGCPFKCNYCYWGAATGSRVHYYEEDRIDKEFRWLCEHFVYYVFIADANWGIKKRDVELSRHLGDLKKEYGFPQTVYFCGSKNNPDRVAEITEIFHDADMVTTQSIALQTMNPETLDKVDRGNIRTETYTKLQERVNKKNISSFVEMIWPLPGETLTSFKEGLGQLCRLRAQSVIVYPLLLMNNVALNDRRLEYGLVTVTDSDPNSEAEMVIGTNEVSKQEYRQGLLYMYALAVLYSLRGLWCTSRYVAESRGVAYADLFSEFVQHCKGYPDDPYVAFCRDSVEEGNQWRFDAIGMMVHLSLHAERASFDRLLKSFVTTRSWWSDETARAYFEVDVLNRPYIYGNTPIEEKEYEFEWLSIRETTAEGYLVEVPARCRPVLEEAVLGVSRVSAGSLFEINHRQRQLPFMPGKEIGEHYTYCQDMLHKIGSVVPVWSGQAA